MDSDILGRKRKALVDPSKLGGLIRGYARADDLDSLWDLHRQHPARPDLAEAIGRILARKSTDAAEPSLFECKGACFPQLTYADCSRLIELGEFEVDNDQSLASKLEVCGFVPDDQAKPGQDCYDSWITQERFPFQQKGKRTIRLALINAGKQVQYEQDFAAMAKRMGRQMCDHAH